MPAIPQFASQASYQGATPLPQEDPRSAGAAAAMLAQALDNTSRQFASVAAASARQRQADAAEAERINTITQLGSLRAAVDMEADPGQIVTRWQEGVSAIQKDIAARVKDPMIAGIAGRDLAMMAARDHIDVLRLANTRTTEASRAQLDASLSTFAAGAASARDPGERQQLLNAGEQAIASRIAGGTLRADDGEKMRQTFLGRVDQATVLGQINRNPGQALAALADPKMFPNLDPVARERLFSAATTAVNTRTTQAEAAERRAERAGRLLADRTANDLYAQIARAENGDGPMPTVADVARNRDWLSPGETSALLSRLRQSGAAKDQPDAVSALQPLVDRLDPDEFNARATRELNAGRLTPDTYRTMVSQNRGARKDDAPASAYRSGRAHVSDALDPGNVVGGQFMRGPLAAARSNALADFDTWAAANPTATRDQAVAHARELVGRYQVGADAESKLALPRPYGFQGARDQITPADVQAAAARAQAARAAGKMTDDDLRREVDVLESWSAVLGREAAKPPPPPKPGTRGAGVNTRPAP